MRRQRLVFEIGTTLREARLRRGLDIARCEAETKVRGKYLRAMEEEQFDLLPAPTYVRGFLRSYAEYLDLDGQIILDEYESRFGAVSDPLWEESGRPAQAARRRPRRRERTPRSGETRLLWLAIGGVMSVALIVWLGVGGQKETQAPVPTPSSPPAASASGAAEKPKVVMTFTAVGAGADVEVRARNSSGMTLVDGLDAGDSRRFAVARSLWMRVGDPAGLELTVGGVRREIPSAGTFIVTRDGLRPLSAG